MIPERMQALVLPAPGEFEVREVSVPSPAPQEVLCRIHAVSICGSDPEILRGDLAGRWPPSYPFIPGHEWSGEVVAVGEGVVDFVVGDRVSGEAHRGCGYCRHCLDGRYTLCFNYGRPETGHRHYGFVSDGAFAQYNAYSIKSITKMPSGVSFREAALTDPAGTVLHGLEISGVTPGGTVAVIGPGPIGLMTMKVARLMGAARVIVIGRGARLEAARRLGADDSVNFEKEDPVEAVREATDHLGVDEAIECSGAPGTFDQAVRMVRKGGKVVLLGVPPDHVREQLPFKYIVHNEIAIFGSRANPNVSAKLLSWMAAGKLELRDLITHCFPLEDFSTALATFVERRENALKVVIEPNSAEET